jgi:DNA-binding Lrp family transcriptional regulator
MSLPSGDISPLIFRQVVGENVKDVSLDGRLLSLFLALDGEKSLATLAQTIGLSPDELRKTVTRLLELQLIEPLEKNFTYLDPEFYRYLTLQYAKAIGPLAGILIEEELLAAGYHPARISKKQAVILVETLAREIQRKEKKDRFIRDMGRKITEKGYPKG